MPSSPAGIRFPRRLTAAPRIARLCFCWPRLRFMDSLYIPSSRLRCTNNLVRRFLKGQPGPMRTLDGTFVVLLTDALGITDDPVLLCSCWPCVQLFSPTHSLYASQANLYPLCSRRSSLVALLGLNFLIYESGGWLRQYTELPARQLLIVIRIIVWGKP